MRIAKLIDIYGELLSKRRREIIEAYYFDDLSLSEISLNTGISRQGVRDSIKKSEAELRGYEEKLGLLEKDAVFSRERSFLAQRIEAAEDALHRPDANASEIADSLGEIAGRVKELNLLG